MKRNNIDKCRSLRRDQTDAEKKLWEVLRNRQMLGVKFRRQFCIGNYILDFYSPEHNLCIEADGGQHFEDEGRRNDEIRTMELSKFGVKILRFNNEEILNSIDVVCAAIQEAIEQIRGNHPSP